MFFYSERRTSELELLAETIKTTTSKHDKLKHLENEKKILQKKLKQVENIQFNSQDLKLQFLDGAIWMRKNSVVFQR